MAMIQLTAAGVALIEANTGPVVVNTFQLGSAYNYTPEPTDTAIHGTEVFSGIPTTPIAVNANIVKYSLFLDYPLGPFQFGEFGLYVGATLFALGTTSQLEQKLALTSVDPGNAIRIDIYLSMVGSNYAMWLDLNQSNNSFRMGVLQSPDYLPPSSGAVPNAYVVQGANVSQSAFLAYTDTNGLWNFDAYDFAQQAAATITATDNSSVTLAFSQYAVGMSPQYFGEVILQFATGALYGIVRYVSTAVISGDTVTLGFSTPLAMLPAVGDKFLVFGRRILSTTVANLPIASSTQLGAVIIGSTLTVDALGNLNVDDAMLPVTSVNGQNGAVELTASDIIDIAQVAITGQYSDLLNPPATYTLPPATTTTLGGVKAPSVSEAHLTVAADGTIDLAFNPVKTVNGVVPDPSSGNVVLPVTPTPTGLINAAPLSASTDLNTVVAVGLYFATAANVSTLVNAPGNLLAEATIEVIPLYSTGTGDVIQRFTTATTMWWRGLTGSTWSGWQQISPVLTHTEQTIVATSVGQTVFVTEGYPIGYVEVFLAGLRIQPNVDFSAPDGMNINIINSALAAQIQIGAVLTVSSYSTYSIAVPNSMYNNVSITTTSAGQTIYTVPGGYPPNLLNVFYGPYHLVNGVDYSATNGETITLLTITGTIGTILNVESWASISIANAIEASVLGSSGGAALVGYGASTVAATLAALVGGLTPQVIPTLTNGQTAFTVPEGYTPNMLSVYYGPLRLINGVDYTATDGETINLIGITTTIGTDLSVDAFTQVAMLNAVPTGVLGGPTGANMVGFGASTVGTTLTNIQAGTTPGMFTTVAASSSAPSTSTTTGALTVVGGAGIAGSLNVGGASSFSTSVTPIAGQAMPVIGTVVRLTGLDGTTAKIAIDSYVNTGNPTAGVSARAARGTAATPLAIQNADILASFAAHGYGATMFQPVSTGALQIVSEGVFTDISQPTALSFLVTPSGAVTKSEKMRLSSMGVLEIESNISSTSINTGSAVITGGLGVSGAVYAGSFQGPQGNLAPNTGAYTSLTASGAVTLTEGTASTTTTTGTLVVTGGVGVSGAINVGGTVQAPAINGSSGAATLDSFVIGSITPEAAHFTTTTATGTVQSMSGGFVFPDGSTQGTAQGYNRLINGGMGVDQRNNGALQTIIAGSALAYTVDRWYAYCTGANVTGQRVAGGRSGLTAERYQYQFTGAAGCTGISFGQRIETSNSYDLNGTTATLSVALSNSLLTTVTWTAYYANTTDTFGTIASPTVTQIATGTFTVSPTVALYQTQIAIPAAATTGIQIVLSVGAQISGTWTIGNVQLERSTVASPFVKNKASAVLAECQRYYQSFMLLASTTANVGTTGLPVTMRTTPTLVTGTPSTGTGAAYTVMGSETLYQSTANSAIATCTVSLTAEI